MDAIIEKPAFTPIELKIKIYSREEAIRIRDTFASKAKGIDDFNKIVNLLAQFV